VFVGEKGGGGGWGGCYWWIPKYPERMSRGDTRKSNACPCAGEQSSAGNRVMAATTETAEIMLHDLCANVLQCPAIERAHLKAIAHLSPSTAHVRLH
jgi:hypothetical protein